MPSQGETADRSPATIPAEMAEWDIDKLANEVARVCTAGLGRPLRKGAEVDQLLAVARLLLPDPTLPSFRLYEEALLPSIERLGDGPMGRLAQIEFGIAAEARQMRYMNQRETLASEKLHMGPYAVKARAQKMHKAIAEDLVTRLALARS